MQKTILISGANSGFGKAIAEKLATYGHRLILTGRNEKLTHEVADNIRKTTPASVHVLCFDVRDFNACQQAINSLPEEFKKIDVLINNAGLALELNPVHKGDLADWDQMIDTNIKGILHLTRLISPQMVERHEGHIINIGSTASYEVYPGGNVYCATKHAVLALTKGMREDFLPYGIKVTQIAPGAAETAFSIVRFKGDKERADKVYEGYQPLVAEDIANVVDYVLSLPPHVCLNEIVMTCTAQYNGVIHKEK